MKSELEEIRSLATPLQDPRDLDRLVEAAAGSRVVLLGEASHGTSEYYRWRAEVSKRLIAEHGFGFVAVEGDWPDCFAVNRWVKDRDGAPSARDVLRCFDRWPTWMWANEEVADFVEWLRAHNRKAQRPVGFYGLDVYSLWESMRALLGYLEEHEPQSIDAALQAWRCFEPYAEDPQEYAWSTRLSPETCEDAVVELLEDVRARRRVDANDPEAQLDAEQNAEVAAGAERYYRTMVRGDAESWNVRDCHMADTLDRLLRFHGPDARAIVWEHNTHVGDARATSMARHGMVNVGQLARDRHGRDEAFLVGFAGYRGSVIAGSHWGAPMRSLPVPQAVSGSHEALLHDALGRDSLLVFGAERGRWLGERRGHRAIGVVYDPRAEYGNYVPTVMGERYDALVYFDDTEALHPLHVDLVDSAEMETYPFAR